MQANPTDFEPQIMSQIEYDRGELKLTGSVAALFQLQTFRKLLATLYERDWSVYAKPPFGGAEQVYRYLGRYTHRVAISNARLISHENGCVQLCRKGDCAKES